MSIDHQVLSRPTRCKHEANIVAEQARENKGPAEESAVKGGEIPTPETDSEVKHKDTERAMTATQGRSTAVVAVAAYVVLAAYVAVAAYVVLVAYPGIVDP